MMFGSRVRFVMLLAAAAACGGSSSYGGSSSGSTGTTGAADGGGTVTATGNTTDGGATSVVLKIRGMAFSPENLTVPPGATVEVENDDGNTPHSVTSESTPGAFTPGAVAGISFDTGIFTGKASFSIPANATVGTVVPFYCRVHTSTMVDATKVQITIGAASTTPAAPTTPATPTPAPSMPGMPGY